MSEIKIYVNNILELLKEENWVIAAALARKSIIPETLEQLRKHDYWVVRAF